MQQLIELFFKGAAGLLMDLDNGAATGDAALLYSASHALKSASANLGAVVLSTHCKELEALAKSGTVPDAAAAGQGDPRRLTAPSKHGFRPPARVA